jgi:hypothetical protein
MPSGPIRISQHRCSRNELETLIQAIYPPSQIPPTLTQILQNQANDVIVTQASQDPGRRCGSILHAERFGAHRRCLPATAGPILGGSNSNVLDSLAVNQTVVCFLLNEGAASCTSAPALAAQPAIGSATSSETYQQQPMKFSASERLTLGPLPHAILGTPLDIPLQLSGLGLAAGVTSLFVSQADPHGEIQAGSGPAALRVSDSTSYVEVVPQRLGPITFTITAWFADGGLATSSVNADVQPPASPPLSFTADVLPVLVITLGSAEPIARLHPVATYPGILENIPVPSEFLQYTVLPAAGPTPVSIEPNGLIRALQPGRATIEVHFGSASDAIPVIVKPAQ